MTESPLTLAGDFASPSRQDWEAEVLKVLNRRRPEGKELTIEKAMKRLTTVTVDELVIDPLYTADDVELGYPSVTPFTRGTSLRTGTIHAWDITTLHEDADVAFSNAAVLEDLAKGATSLWLRVDPDAIAPSDLAGVLAGVIPELARLRVTSRTQQLSAAKALADFWRAGGHAATVGGSLGIDALGHTALTGQAPE